MLKALVTHIIKTLVENPGAVHVEKTHRDQKDVLVVSVDQGDIGRVIGKDGQTIKAIRTLVFAIKGDDSVSDIIINDQE